MLAANNLITRNAWQAFDAHVEREAADGITFTKAKLIRSMADYLNAQKCGEYTIDRVRSALRRYMPDPPGVPCAFWRVEILDAFAYVTECRLHRLVAPGFNGKGDIDVADYGSLLAQTMGKHVSERDLGKIARAIRDHNQPRAFAQLIMESTITLTSAATRSEAHERISRAILGSDLWSTDGKKRLAVPLRSKSRRKQK